MEKFQGFLTSVKGRVQKNFRFATINFLFILIFISVFQMVFGAENSIVGVIFIQLMMSSMMRDMTATPIKHFFGQTLILLMMTVSACVVVNIPPVGALPINFAAIFLILYTFTFEYVRHLYFPYILSYLFLICISPIGYEALPTRLLSVVAGCVSMMVYQMVNGRHRIVETTRGVLLKMIGEAESCIRSLLDERELEENCEQLRIELCRLSQILYDRRKRVLCISDAAFASLDCARGLENLVLELYGWRGTQLQGRRDLLNQVLEVLSCLKAYTCEEVSHIPEIHLGALHADDAEEKKIYEDLCYIRTQLLSMTQPEKKTQYRRTLQSLSFRLKAALHVSPVRVVYALRVALLLAFCITAVSYLNMEHGRWILFTIASVSLPYADDIDQKAKKRILATLMGGAFCLLSFSLVSSIPGRTFIMLLSGYLNFYFIDYSTTFTCATIGALGGALLTQAFGFVPVGHIVLIRLGTTLAGVLIAMVGNRWFCPFQKSLATRQLLTKYIKTSKCLTKLCKEQDSDSQLYYSLLIQVLLQEEALRKNAKALDWSNLPDVLKEWQNDVRHAHRNRYQGTSLTTS